MKLTCAHCGREFEREYRISASRAARPQYCSRQCVSWSQSNKADRGRLAKFQARIDKSGGADACWPWTHRHDPHGYGRFDMAGKPQLAHRIAFFAANPEADRSMAVCHSCDNPPCCNPAHLWLGTNVENNADRHEKGRTRTGTTRGADHPQARLTPEQAQAIFKDVRPASKTASEYGISANAVRLIKIGKNWAHVTGGRRAS